MGRTNFERIVESPEILARNINLMFVNDVNWQKLFLEWLKEDERKILC